MPGALKGVRVLEFSETIAAPLTGMLLGDVGADVISMERPGGDLVRRGGVFAPAPRPVAAT
jgi:crotonobetainyl-CoA:carnitine CoA-transferase CaiB-like acyl-CoA transferase